MKTRLITVLLVAGLLASCGISPIKRAESYAAQDEWLRAVLEYRRALKEHPGDVELTSRLRQTELKAAEHYYHRGVTQRDRGDLEGAIATFQQGVVAKSDYSKLQEAMLDVLSLREAGLLYADALRNLEIDRSADARALLQRALEVYPSHAAAARQLKLLAEEDGLVEEGSPQLSSRAPISLRFNQTPTKRAFEHIAAAYGLNVLFDNDVQDTSVTLRAEQVTFAQALELLLSASKTFYRQIGPTTLLIAPDTTEKRARYEDQVIRTFHLKSIRAKEMAELIKGVLSPKKLVLNEEFNSLVIRDSSEVIALAQRMINLNDRQAAELLLEVEILEVNRNKTEQLGLDWGSQVSIAFPAFQLSESLSQTLRQGTATLPNVVFRYFKQDVDAKILANPKVRVINNRTATIHIGDRVPLRTSTILDATGQLRTTFEYRDIGIKLKVLPHVHLDNATTVHLNLEVSSIGQNLGTPDEPAYSIGTRNADTHMLLRDGETAILGGLIRDEERRVHIRVPGLGDIPLVGALFSQYNSEDTRTDVLLTITPRVVRGWSIAPPQELTLYSGTESRYAAAPLFATLRETATGDARPRIQLGAVAQTDAGGGSQTPAVPPSPLPEAMSIVPEVRFSQELYSLGRGAEQTLNIVGRSFTTQGRLRLELMYNPEILEILAAEAGDAGTPVADIDPERGIVSIELDKAPDSAEEVPTLAKLRVRGRAPGISYLLFNASELHANGSGVVNTRTSAARAKVD